MTIHTCGDSHCMSGWKNCEDVKIHLIPGTLCYSFGIQKLNRCNINFFNIQDDDTIVFSFGEIDCRCHIHKYVNENIKYTDLINEIVNNYMDAIKENLEVCNVKLKNVCVYNVVPPVKKEDITIHLNENYPHLGSNEDRKKYTLYFNSCLKEKCKENNIIFIDIYDAYCDEYGYLNHKYSDGIVHIEDPVFLKEFINRNLL